MHTISRNDSLQISSPSGNTNSFLSSLSETQCQQEITFKSFQSTFTNQRKIPIKIILNDDEEVQENNSETTDVNSLHNFYPNILSKNNLGKINLFYKIFTKF